jgi:hypothetical protein
MKPLAFGANYGIYGIINMFFKELVEKSKGIPLKQVIPGLWVAQMPTEPKKKIIRPYPNYKPSTQCSMC